MVGIEEAVLDGDVAVGGYPRYEAAMTVTLATLETAIKLAVADVDVGSTDATHKTSAGHVAASSVVESH